MAVIHGSTKLIHFGWKAQKWKIRLFTHTFEVYIHVPQKENHFSHLFVVHFLHVGIFSWHRGDRDWTSSESFNSCVYALNSFNRVEWQKWKYFANSILSPRLNMIEHWLNDSLLCLHYLIWLLQPNWKAELDRCNIPIIGFKIMWNKRWW